MEQKFVIITKKTGRLMRVMFFMLKKGIAKRKFLLDLNATMKPHRAKIAASTIPGEYEFSCRDTPRHRLPSWSLFSTGHMKKHEENKRIGRRHATPNLYVPPLIMDDDCNDQIIINSAVLKALDTMITSNYKDDHRSPAAMDEQVMTIMADSSLSSLAAYGDDDGSDDCHVDKAAENFIRRFYNDRICENN